MRVEAKGVADALRKYEAERIPRTSRIVRLSRQAGSMGQLANPLACRLRNFVAASLPRGAMQRSLRSIVDYRQHLT